MEYNKKAFAKAANIKVMWMWLIMNFVLSGAYIGEILKGQKSVEFFIVMELIAWVPFIAGLIVMKVRGGHTRAYQEIAAFGYGFFYLYIMLTAPGTLAFTYVLPFACMLVVYKDKWYMIRIGIINTLLQIFCIFRNYHNGMNTAQDISNYEIQFGIILFSYISFIVAIGHLLKSDGALLGSVQNNLERVINTVEQVKEASNQVVDGVTVVRELAEENKQGATVVVETMEDLAVRSRELGNRIDSSMEMSEDINKQVQNVAELIEKIVELSDKSATHAVDSSKELENMVETTNVMARLSQDVDSVLNDFREQFEKVKEETGTIAKITYQTNLLALNASIEAARAGESGKGFAVVADQIRSLSLGTQTSSDGIMEALTSLESTSQKMTESVTTILGLISETLVAMKQVNESVGMIAEDSKQLGNEIEVVDSAMKSVEYSNKSMVENMREVQDTMVSMADGVVDSETTTVTMMSKYEETARNVGKIEAVVGKLVEELGAGGFMNMTDILPGMKIMFVDNTSKAEHTTEVAGVSEKEIEIVSDAKTQTYFAELRRRRFKVSVVVKNALYIWENCKVVKDGPTYEVQIEGGPQVVNRRKYPRIPLTNACEILLKGETEPIIGRMVNLSAGGFAFTCTDKRLASASEQKLDLTIKDFDLLKDRALSGVAHRSSTDGSNYIVGCRMLADDKEIEIYVENFMNH